MASIRDIIHAKGMIYASLSSTFCAAGLVLVKYDRETSVHGGWQIMFDSLGKMVTRFWPWLLVVWGLALAGLSFTAPNWDDVAQAGQFVFLPDNAPSRNGQKLFDRAFPDDLLASSV